MNSGTTAFVFVAVRILAALALGACVGGFAGSVWAGISGTHRITPHARRMIVLAGSGASFDESSRNLKELCHLSISNDVVRRVCDEEGCDTRLSVDNDGAFCSLHQPMETPRTRGRKIA